MSPNLLVKCSLLLTLETISTNSEIHADENDMNYFLKHNIKDGGNVDTKYDDNKRVRVLLVQTQFKVKPLFYRHNFWNK